MKALRRMLLLGLLYCVPPFDCHAYPFATCTTTYTTNGWFEYELTLEDDPFWDWVDSLGLDAMQITNALQVGPIPAGWTNIVLTDRMEWNSLGPPLEPLLRPQTVRFSVQSPYTSFRRDARALSVLFTGLYRDFTVSPYGSGNLAGYCRMEGLVPCPESEADGSPPTMTSVFELIPDIKLAGFVTISNQLRGMRFYWNYTFTMQVEASQDLTSWTNVAYVIGDSGTNTWTSNIPLDQLGKYFRLRLYSKQKHPEMLQ